MPADALRRAGYTSEIPGRRADLSSFDVVVLQKAYQERDSLDRARDLRRRGVRLVLDLCDNHFFNPAGRRDFAARAERLEEMLSIVDAVSVSTTELQRVVAHERTTVVDDAIEFTDDKPVAPDGRRTEIVWFGHAGSAGSGAGIADLAGIVPQLTALNSHLPLSLTVITNSRRAVRRAVRTVPFPIRFRRWRQSSFARHVVGCQVCVIPVQQNPFTVVKTANRVITALMLGVPVVASRLPSYEEFASCIRFDDWHDNIAAYATDRELASNDVKMGQNHIMAKYTRSHLVGQWTTALRLALDAERE